MNADLQAVSALAEPFRVAVLRFLAAIEEAQTDTVGDDGTVRIVLAENAWRVVSHGEPRADGLGIDLSLSLTWPIFVGPTTLSTEAELEAYAATLGVRRVAGTPARWSADGLAQPESAAL